MSANNLSKNGDSITFDSELEIFLQIAGSQSEKTAISYRGGLAYFKMYLQDTLGWRDDRPIAELVHTMLQEFPVWLRKQTYQRGHSGPLPLSDTSRRLYLVATSRFIRFLVSRKHLPAFDYADYMTIKDEFDRAAKLQPQPITLKIPPDDLVLALVEAAWKTPEIAKDEKPLRCRRLTLVWKRNLAIILALKSSGMRVGELVRLTRENLDYDRRGAWVTGKGKKVRFVAFDQASWAAIQDYLAYRRDEALSQKVTPYPLFCRHDNSTKNDVRKALTIRTVQYVIEELAEKAHVAERFNISPHSLRHYFADKLLTVTEGNITLVQDALGHSDPKTTRVYTQGIKVEDIAYGVQKIEKKEREDQEKRSSRPKNKKQKP